MKSAKEMFEELGYKMLGTLKSDDDYIIVAYKKDVYDDSEYIYFYGDDTNEIRVYLEDNRGKIYPPLIELEELQAINKQVEELGWK